MLQEIWQSTAVCIRVQLARSLLSPSLGLAKRGSRCQLRRAEAGQQWAGCGRTLELIHLSFYRSPPSPLPTRRTSQKTFSPEHHRFPLSACVFAADETDRRARELTAILSQKDRPRVTSFNDGHFRPTPFAVSWPLAPRLTSPSAPTSTIFLLRRVLVRQ